MSKHCFETNHFYTRKSCNLDLYTRIYILVYTITYSSYIYRLFWVGKFVPNLFKEVFVFVTALWPCSVNNFTLKLSKVSVDNYFLYVCSVLTKKLFKGYLSVGCRWRLSRHQTKGRAENSSSYSYRVNNKSRY